MQMPTEDDDPLEPVIIAAAGAAHGHSAMVAYIRARVGFSLPHVAAAEHFAEQLRAHEAAHATGSFGPSWEYSRWYASAAILLSSSSMEAAVDETQDDLKMPEQLVKPVRLKGLWTRVAAVIEYVGAEPFEEGQKEYDSADLLRSLRNGLAHPKAEWSDALQSHKELTERINKEGLPLSPFLPDPTTAFPLGCMSAGVATWSAATARRFIKEFRKRCGLEC
jgi:hypothetical protein